MTLEEFQKKMEIATKISSSQQEYSSDEKNLKLKTSNASNTNSNNNSFSVLDKIESALEGAVYGKKSIENTKSNDEKSNGTLGLKENLQNFLIGIKQGGLNAVNTFQKLGNVVAENVFHRSEKLEQSIDEDLKVYGIDGTGMTLEEKINKLIETDPLSMDKYSSTLQTSSGTINRGNDIISNTMNAFSNLSANMNYDSIVNGATLTEDENGNVVPDTLFSQRDVNAVDNKIKELQEEASQNTEQIGNEVLKYTSSLMPSVGDNATSLVLNAVAPGLGSTFFTASATNSYAMDGKELGLSDEGALTYGAILGFLDGTLENIELGNLSKASKNMIEGSTKEAVKSYLVSMVDNYIQEALMEPTQESVNQLFTGSSDWSGMLSRMNQAGISGAVSSAILGGASAGVSKTANVVNTYQQNKVKTQITEKINNNSLLEENAKNELLSVLDKFDANTLNNLNKELDTINEVTAQIEKSDLTEIIEKRRKKDKNNNIAPTEKNTNTIAPTATNTTSTNSETTTDSSALQTLKTALIEAVQNDTNIQADTKTAITEVIEKTNSSDTLKNIANELSEITNSNSTTVTTNNAEATVTSDASTLEEAKEKLTEYVKNEKNISETNREARLQEIESIGTDEEDPLGNLDLESTTPLERVQNLEKEIRQEVSNTDSSQIAFENMSSELKDLVYDDNSLTNSQKNEIIEKVNKASTTSELKDIAEEISNIANTTSEIAPVRESQEGVHVVQLSEAQQYKNNKIKIDDKVLNNALTTVQANRQGRRTKQEWLQVAQQIGSNIQGDIETAKTYAYKTWYQLHPNQATNLNRQGQKYVKFTQEEYVDAVLDSYQKANNAGIDTTSNSEQLKVPIKENVEKSSKIEYNKNGLRLAVREYKAVTSAINTDSPNMKNGINYKFYGDYLYIFYKEDFDSYSFTQKIEIDGNEQLLNLVRKEIENGTYKASESTNNLLEEYKDIDGIYNSDNVNVTKRETNITNVELAINPKQQRGKSDRRTANIGESKRNNESNELENSEKGSFLVDEIKEKQLEIIKNTNPMTDDYHVGIRTIEDIKTFDEVINDDESFLWGDFSKEDAEKALEKGKITIYSSYPIENGVFVSTSKQQALEYAGQDTSKVYSKEVPLNSVAWINGDEGQYASVTSSTESENLNVPIKNNKIKLNKEQQDTLSKSLYVINKEAKRIRDARETLKGILFDDFDESDKNLDNYLEQKLNKNYEQLTTKYDEYENKLTLDNIDDYIDKAESDVWQKEDDVEKYGEDGETEYGNTYQDELELSKDYLNFLEQTKEELKTNEEKLHEVLSQLEEEKRNLYQTKDEVIKKLNISPKGYHEFDGGLEMAYYEFGDFSFHLLEDDVKKLTNLGKINGQITSEQQDVGIDVNTAIKNLQDFVESKTESNTLSDENLNVPIKSSENTLELSNKANENVLNENGQEYYEAPTKENQEKVKNGKTRRRYKTIIESDLVSDEAKQISKELMGVDTYVPESNTTQLNKADEMIKSVGVNRSLSTLKTKIDSGQKILAEDIAIGDRLIQYYSKVGDKQKLQDAIQYTAMAGTEAGRTVQAFSMIAHQSSEGQALWIQRSVNKINQQIAGQKGGKIQVKNGQQYVVKNGEILENVKLFDFTQDMQERIMKASGRDELKQTLNEIYEELGDQVPKSTMEKIDSWRYFCMLANPKTHIRNIVGNTAMGGVQSIKNVVAGAIEDIVAISNPNMERTKSLIWETSREIYDYAKEDIKNVEDRLGLNQNKYSPTSRIKSNQREFKTDFLNDTLGKAYQTNSKLLEIEDGWGLKSNYAKAFASYVSANGIDINEITDAQLSKARNYAIQEAKEATFHQESQLATLISQLGKNSAGKFIIDSMVPFKSVPINVAKTGMAYSPLQLIKSTTVDVANLRNGKITLNQYIDNVSKGITGTGIALVGYALANMGILKANGNDEDKEDYDEAQGYQTFSITIGNQNFSLSWLAPTAIPLFMGAELSEIMNKTKENGGDVSDDAYDVALDCVTNFIDVFANAMNPMTEMSMLSGLTSVLRSYDQENYLVGLGTNMAKTYVNQFIPTALGNVAKITDDYERDTTSTKSGTVAKAIDTVALQTASKIPFVRELLPTKKDTWGNEVESPSLPVRIFENTIAPYTRKEISSNKVDKYLNNLYTETQNKDILPDTISKTLTFNGETYRYTNEEYNEYKAKYGEIAYNKISEMIKDKAFKALSEEEQATIIDKVYSDAKEEIKEAYAKKYKIDYERTDKQYEVEEEIENGLSVTNAYIYKTIISKQESEKDEEGNTITGSQMNNKVTYIMNMSISNRQKQHLLNITTTDTDTNITVEDLEKLNGDYLTYINQSGKTPEDGGLSAREKYMSLINAGISVDQLNTFYSQISSITGSDTTSKKQAVFNFINSLSLSIPQKMILLAKQYSSFKNLYLKEIVTYIVGLKNTTRKEKLQTLITILS